MLRYTEEGNSEIVVRAVVDIEAVCKFDLERGSLVVGTLPEIDCFVGYIGQYCELVSALANELGTDNC